MELHKDCTDLHLRQRSFKALLCGFESGYLGLDLLLELRVNAVVVQRPYLFERVPVDLAEVVGFGQLLDAVPSGASLIELRIVSMDRSNVKRTNLPPGSSRGPPLRT